MFQGVEVTQHAQKAKILFDHFCTLIGAQGETAPNLNLDSTYSNDRISPAEALALTLPWSDTEIKNAICSWKNNKSPGPDGFTTEFYKTFLETLLPDLKQVFQDTNLQPATTLWPLNDSYIVLVPKKDAPTSPNDYRPINLVNGIQKVYSKLMANRIKPLLAKLLSPNQTGFLRNRSILHGFHYAQQVIQSATKQKIPIAVFKADIHKAFDTLDWNFLLKVLEARGFPQLWTNSIRNRVLMGTSRIIINSVAGKEITLKRGVRQGDPISPYLFNLAIDFLSRWMQRLSDLNFIEPPFPQCKPCVLYADDTLLLLKPNITQILKIKLLLSIFGLLSGLQVNLQKSELVTNSLQPSLSHTLAALINCKPAAFPINYLGLPLSDKNLTRTNYTPLLDKIQAKLSGWKAALLTIGGRAILTNAVLTAVPQYFMSIFLLPAWLIRKIDQIRKRFLWHGHKEQHIRGLYMVNWKLATKPRQQGGLGIRDIRWTNYALLLKWMWQWHDPNQDWWKQATPMTNASDKPWLLTQTSGFWKSLKTLSPIFYCSVQHNIGNGNFTQFWHDCWYGKPFKHEYPNLYQAVLYKNASVSQCRDGSNWHIQTNPLNSIAQAEKEEMLYNLRDMHTTQEQDRLTWTRASGGFSVRAVYNFLALSLAPNADLNNIWAIKAPLRIAIFTWLMLSNKLTTVDNLKKRGWQIPSMCILCRENEESGTHIFVTCPLATEVRQYVYSVFIHRHNNTAPTASPHPFNILKDCTIPMTVRKWETVICFVLWRERCYRIFSDKFDTTLGLIRQIQAECISWFGSQAQI